MKKTLQADNHLTRRSLLGGALTLGGGAAVAAATASARTAPAAATAVRPIQITASAAMNNVETDSGKVYGSSRDGVVSFHGIPYAASTEGANRFLPPQRPTPWTGIRSALYWGWACPQTYNSSANGLRVGWTHDDESFMFEWEDGKPSEDCCGLRGACLVRAASSCFGSTAAWDLALPGPPGLNHCARALGMWRWRACCC